MNISNFFLSVCFCVKIPPPLLPSMCHYYTLPGGQISLSEKTASDNACPAKPACREGPWNSVVPGIYSQVSVLCDLRGGPDLAGYKINKYVGHAVTSEEAPLNTGTCS